MTETPPGTDSTDGRDGDWNRQTSTVDWEGWIAEANEADAKRAAAQAAWDAAVAAAPAPQYSTPPGPEWQQPSAQQFSDSQPNYPPPTGYPAPGSDPAPTGYATGSYPPPTGYPASGYPPPTGYAAGSYPPPSMPSGHPEPFVPFQAPTKPALDVVSVLALIFGILPTVVIGFTLGIIGLGRTSRTTFPARRGRGLAVTGIILSLLWVAAAIPFVIKDSASQRASGGSVTKATTMSPLGLRAGDCYDDTILANRQVPASKAVSTVKVVPCSQLHNAVVYAVITLPAGDWTNQLDKLAIANQQCRPLAVKYFNGIVLNPNLRLGAFAPDQTRWGLGLRNAGCVVVDPDKSFVGDIRQDR